MSETVLANPIWTALTSVHAPLVLAEGLAARYPRDVSPLAGLAEPSARAFADLRRLVAPGEQVALFTTAPVEPAQDWRILRARIIDQMVCEDRVREDPAALATPLIALTVDDVPDMLALTAATEPGPFGPETIRMGRYCGLRAPDGRLMAMAGERLGLDRFTELSAVCTDPQFQGRGLAKGLLTSLCARIQSEGRTPFLHVKTENAAKRLYEKIGFRVSRPIQFTVLGR